jgi:hypothetical protein
MKAEVKDIYLPSRRGRHFLSPEHLAAPNTCDPATIFMRPQSPTEQVAGFHKHE